MAKAKTHSKEPAKTAEDPSGSFVVNGRLSENDPFEAFLCGTDSILRAGSLVAVLMRDSTRESGWFLFGVGDIATKGFPNTKSFKVEFKQLHPSSRGAPAGLTFETEHLAKEGRGWKHDGCMIALVLSRFRSI